MSLDQGKHIPPQNFMRVIHGSNLRILTTWMTVGADVEYGKYAMLGARMGCYSTSVDSNEWIQISNLDKMADLFANALVEDKVDEDLEVYGNSIRQRLDIPCADFDEHQSKFFKFVMPHPINKGVQDREYK